MAVVVIDPGHGGTKPVGDSSPNNATSFSGLLEKHLTLNVARHVQTALTSRGHVVQLTRTVDTNLGLGDRAQVAKSAAADAFVSIHFNGFADTTVQGTETWVHAQASAESRMLAASVQSAVLPVTGHRDRGVQAKRLGVLTPARHHSRTAGCLAELSFITAKTEDVRLHDPKYLEALGHAVAKGVDDYVSRAARLTLQDEELAESFSAAVVETVVEEPALVKARALNGVSSSGPRLTDVPGAFAAIAKAGLDSKFSGRVKDDGGFKTHLQGLATSKDFHLFTQSDEGKPSGRILIADRRSSARKLVGEFTLPRIDPGPPFHFHAGGCQLAGNHLAVPSETGQNRSVVSFFDISDVKNIREVDQRQRIIRGNRDAAAVGMTSITEAAGVIWVAAVYDSGTVDFYTSADLAAGAPFSFRFTFKIDEKHHQALLLLTDVQNRMFAVGINRTFIGDNVCVLYQIDFAGQSMKALPDKAFSPKGGASLRWGASLEVLSDAHMVMHCTSKHYRDGCHVNAFQAIQPLEEMLLPSARKRQVKKSATRRTGTTPVKRRAKGAGTTRRTRSVGTRRRSKR